MHLPSPVRLLGIDLGVISDHTAVVVDGTGRVHARRRARSTVTSLAALEAAALATAEAGTHLVVVIEPTGPAWRPVAVFYGRRGHTVLRVTSAKAADLRRFLARHAKSNGIDAETLARLPLVAPTGLTAVEFGSPARASLDRRVRAVARLTAEIGRRKTRIRTLAQQLVPMIGGALSEGLSHTDLAVLECYADPRALLAAGPARLTRLITTTSRGQLDARQGPGATYRRCRGGRPVGGRQRRRPGRPGRRGRQRGPPGPRRRGRASPPRARPGRCLRPGRPGRAGRQPARTGPRGHHPAGRHDGPARTVPQRRRVQGLHRVDPASQ
jgi:Transposase